MARSIGLIPNEIIRYACLRECAAILNVDERIIQNEVKKYLIQRDDKYLENIQKEKEAASAHAAAAGLPPVDMPPVGADDGVPPPPFPPEEAESLYQSYIPEEGREKLVFYRKELELVKILIRHGEKVMCYVETEENTETPLTVIEYMATDIEQDELQFHNPLHRRILAEAEAHLRDENFTAERYFLSHPDSHNKQAGNRDAERPLPVEQKIFENNSQGRRTAARTGYGCSSTSSLPYWMKR